MADDSNKRNPYFLNIVPIRLCRICDSKSPNRAVFNKVDAHLADDIYTYFRIRITNNDTQSKMICMLCMGYIERFREKREFAKRKNIEQNYNMKTNYGSMAEEIGNKLTFVDEFKIVESKMKYLQIKEGIKIEDLKMYEPKIEEFKFEPKIEYIPLTKNFEIEEVGSLFCEHCEYLADTIDTYLAHLIEKHRIYKQLKSNEIKFCPLCNFNYENKIYLKHLQECTNATKVTDVIQNQMMCQICCPMFPDMTETQYRRNFLFCKTMQPLNIRGTLCYKCKHCTYWHYDVEKSMKHASSTCLYYQMNLKYAKSHDEKPIVESLNTIKNEMNCSTTVPDIKPLIDTKPICEDLSSDSIFTKFFNCCNHYHCTKCLNVFSDKHSFHTHLSMCFGIKDEDIMED